MKDFKDEVKEKEDEISEAMKAKASDAKIINDDVEAIIEDSVEETIGKLKAEVDEWKQAYLRKQADFQNFTKRKEKELEELKKFASEKIVLKLVEDVDNLEKAVTASAVSKDFDGLIKGVEIILNKLKSLLKEEGVTEISTEGEFNPEFHHAVLVEHNPDMEDNHIIVELQKGYEMKGKVIRPSMVKVNKKD